MRFWYSQLPDKLRSKSIHIHLSGHDSAFCPIILFAEKNNKTNKKTGIGGKRQIPSHILPSNINSIAR